MRKRARFRGSAIERLEDRALLATFTVSNTDDSGSGSLREAIDLANGDSATDTIVFEIGDGIQTINLATALPTIINSLVLDGSTPAGFGSPQVIVLNGASVSGNGLLATAGDLTVIELTVENFDGNGLFVAGGGDNVSTITNCTFNGNHLHAVELDNVGMVNVDGLSTSKNGGFVEGFGAGLFVNGSNGNAVTIFNSDTDDGIVLDDVGIVSVNNVNSSGNERGLGLFVNSANGNRVTITDSQFDSNNGSGINLTNVGDVIVDFVTASGNDGDGLTVFNSNGDSVTVTDSTFSDNFGDGVHLITVGDVSFTNVTAQANDPGVFVSGAASFFDVDGNFSNNADHGIVLIDIVGDVSLVRTTADDNDADNNGVGDGLNATALGGNLSVRGAHFGRGDDTDDHQQNGVFVAFVAGSITFNDSTGTIQSVTVIDNESSGVIITGDGTTSAFFTNGTYQGNQFDGISLSNLSSATLTNVTAVGNANHGAFLVSIDGAVSIVDGSYSTNDGDGLLIASVFGTVTLTDVAASNNGDSGFEGSEISVSVSVRGGTFDDNDEDNTGGGDGIRLMQVGAVSFTNVTATGNDPGVFVSGAESFSDTNGNFSNNDNHGIQLIDITGDVTLVRTTADNNDADNDGIGDGLNATDGGDSDNVAIGGDVLIKGARFRDTTAAGAQQNGVSIASLVATSTVTFSDSTGVIQSNIVTGNQKVGVLLFDGGTTATFTNGTYSNNGGDGISLASLSGSFTTTGNLTANNNTGDGIDVDSVGVVTLAVIQASGNGSDGLQLSNTGNVTLGGAVASNFNANGDDGIEIDSAGTIGFTNVDAANNTGEGIDLATVGAITFNDVVATGNDPGVLVIGAASFSDNDGVFSDNDDHGIQLIDIAGDVTLVRTTADDNDANNDGTGDGLNATDGGDGDVFAIGGDLLVRGAHFGGSGGVNDHQKRGVFVASLAGAVTFNDSTGTVQSVTVSGNESDGVVISDGGTSATFTHGTYSNNGTNNTHDGIDLSSFSGTVTLTGVTATSNAGNGVRLNGAGGLTVTDVTADSNGAATGLGNGLETSSVGGVVDVNNGSFSSNDGSGFVLSGTYTTLTVDNGSYNSNTTHGLSISGSATTTTLTGVTATLNGTDGVNATNLTGTTTISGGSYSSNSDDGLDLDGNNAAATRLILDSAVNASLNGDDGLFATQFLGLVGNPASPGVQITGGTFSNNGNATTSGDGIQLVSVGDVVFAGTSLGVGGVTATGNDPGVNISSAASFSDTDGNYSNNDNHGIQLIDISGNVTLIRTTVDNNDADNNNTGDGLNATDGGDGDTLAIGGNLLVLGARFRDSDGANDHQERGVFVASIGGSVTFDDSTGVVQSVTGTGNEADGVNITGTGTNTASFNKGAYSTNGDDGIDLDNFGAVTLANLTANGNTSDGFEVSNVTTLNLSDLTLGPAPSPNGSGFGGRITTVTTVNFTTTTAASVDTVTLTAAQFQHDRAGTLQQPVAYSAVTNLNLNSLGGNDTFQIQATTASTTTTVNAGDGNDTINIGSAGNSLDAILGAVTVNGNAGNDTLNVNDQGDGTANNYTITSTTIGRNGAASVGYGTVEFLTLNAGTGNDSINIAGTGASMTTVVNAGSGNDSFEIDGDDLSAGNQFLGNAGADSFVLSVVDDLGADALFDLTSLKIEGNAPAADLANGDTLSIFDSNLSRSHIFTYLSQSLGDIDITSNDNDGYAIPINVRTMEEVDYSGGEGAVDGDTITVVGTEDSDVITVRPTGAGSAEVFLSANVTELPGVAGGAAGPDLIFDGLGSTLFIDGSTPTQTTPGDKLVYLGQGVTTDTGVGAGFITSKVGFIGVDFREIEELLRSVPTTPGDDVIKITPIVVGKGGCTPGMTDGPTRIVYRVQVNGVDRDFLELSDVDEFVVFGGDGNDKITVDLNVLRRVELHGGNGNDTLSGGSGTDLLFGEAGNDVLCGNRGNDVLIGGEGNDKLKGGAGRDILIGGIGQDTLNGNGGDDIVIGDSTEHDDDRTALQAILAEWTSGNSYATRVSNIRDGGGLSDGFNLSADSTVIDDGELDVLFGNAGLDWFFNSEGFPDTLKDKKSNELVN